MPEDEPVRRFYAVRYEDDIPKPGKGMLIPYQRPLVPRVVRGLDHYAAIILVPVAALLFMVTAGVLGTQTYSRLNTASLPAVTIINPLTKATTPLNYGVELALAQPNFFAETRDAFIDSAVTFIEADLSAMRLRYFEDGVLVLATPILAKGEAGSIWQTPSGLYQVETKQERHYSTFGHMYQPWSLSFQGNFFIHGWPQLEAGAPAPADLKAGGIRIGDADMARLYRLVKVNTPILVHDLDAAPAEFVYEPKVPELETPQYLIADVESSTVLAGNNLESVVPIASVTKLMTALVAAEYINLDTSVPITQPTFVQSLIPRLGDRSKVSMYSLLQLLLVESSNEAAEVIAAQVGREKFITLMNEKAKALGMEGTEFADPSGLSASNTSSVSDLLRLTQYIYQNRSFILEVTANQNLATSYVSGEFGELVNFNKVTDLDNFIGGKVGETLAAGQTSVTLHTLPVKGSVRTLAIIILGSTDRNADVTTLYRYAEERFGE